MPGIVISGPEYRIGDRVWRLLVSPCPGRFSGPGRLSSSCVCQVGFIARKPGHFGRAFCFFFEPLRPFKRIIIEAFASVRRSGPISAAKSGFRQESAGRLRNIRLPVERRASKNALQAFASDSSKATNRAQLLKDRKLERKSFECALALATFGA